MSVLSDASLRAYLGRDVAEGGLRVEPLGVNAIQPCSIDVRLGGELLQRVRGAVVDPVAGTGPGWTHAAQADIPHAWLLHPGVLYLGVLLERVTVPDDLICHLYGRSSLAREGITIHQQAGLLDAGYDGHPTLEITVTHTTRLQRGMPIGQLVFQRMTTRAERPYGSDTLNSRYQGDTAPTPARIGGAS